MIIEKIYILLNRVKLQWKIYQLQKFEDYLSPRSISHSNNMVFSALYLLGFGFSGLTLDSLNFSETRLIKAKTVKTFLWKSNFQGASLTDANLTTANLIEADLSRATLENAI